MDLCDCRELDVRRGRLRLNDRGRQLGHDHGDGDGGGGGGACRSLRQALRNDDGAGGRGLRDHRRANAVESAVVQVSVAGRMQANQNRAINLRDGNRNDSIRIDVNMAIALFNVTSVVNDRTISISVISDVCFSKICS